MDADMLKSLRGFFKNVLRDSTTDIDGMTDNREIWMAMTFDAGMFGM